MAKQRESLIIRLVDHNNKVVELDWYALKRSQRREMKRRSPKLVAIIEEAIKTGKGVQEEVLL